MKYVSPQTEKRKQRQKKRKKQLALCVCLVAAIVAVAFAVIAFTGKDKPPHSSSQPDSVSSETADTSESSSVQEDESSSRDESSLVESENSTDTESESSPVSENTVSSDESTTQAVVVNPNRNNQSFISKIKGLFGKEEQQAAFPAMSFGVQVNEAADSIISLSPLATEAILSSPSQHGLIAVSEYCNKRNNQLMTVGTPIIPKVDKIIQLKPDYLIVQTPLGEQDKIKIQQSGITVLQLNAPSSLEDVKEIYRSVAAITKGAQGATDFSEKVYNDLKEKLSLYETALSQVSRKTAVMLFNSYGMTATADTFEGEILSSFFDISVNGKNYFAESVENIAATDPQVIIVSDLITAQQLEQLGFGGTQAYINGNVYYVNIQDFENISAKSIKTLAGIANSVYGDAIQPAPSASPEAEK